MTTSQMGTPGQFPVRTNATQQMTGALRFQCNNTSDPAAANTIDPGGVVSSIVYSATGIQTITLAKRWKRVMAIAQALDTTGTVIAKVTAVVEGSSAANTIVLQTESSGSPAALTAKNVVVHYHLFR